MRHCVPPIPSLLDPRRLLAALVVSTLCVLAASAPSRAAKPAGAYVSPNLLAAAQADPGRSFDVILQGTAGHGASAVAADVRSANAGAHGNALGLKRQLASIAGASAAVTGKQLLQLAKLPGIAAITSDDPVRLTGSISSKQQWPFASGVAKGWSGVTNGSLPQLPAIAVVDSGIDASRGDFGGRVIDQVTIDNSSTTNSPGDGYGHGTFVAGIAAGSAQGYAGAAPSAPLVSIDVMDDQGMALTSDVIAACDWILQHKDADNIRVANFSLHSTAPASVFWDPLDHAVEKLWFAGVTVVTAAGNYGVDGQPSGVRYAPGNDPFVITVGADDVSGSVSPNDDAAAPWSAYGYTYDGFAKPDLAAPGRYMIGPVPPASTLAVTRASSVTAPGYIQLSGTSFASPVVAGTAAYLLALHPDWTPDQVKGALLLSAKAAKSAAPLSIGVGLLDAAAAANVTSPPNPNLALDAFLTGDPAGGSIPVFDSASWGSAAQANASWGSASWGSASWGSASWGSASWGSLAWSSASWGSASWGSASWGSSSLAQTLATASWGSAALGSTATADNAAADEGAPALLDDEQLAAAEAELGIEIAPDGSVSGSGA
ncbi:MAG TPA: S8 family serine peptidase [Gaiellaceae bacterium]|nr:S8 family serine peptidase [Gaiellaceae bacterium]